MKRPPYNFSKAVRAQAQEGALSSVEDGRASWNPSGPKLGTKDKSRASKDFASFGGRLTGGLGQVDLGGTTWQNLFIS